MTECQTAQDLTRENWLPKKKKKKKKQFYLNKAPVEQCWKLQGMAKRKSLSGEGWKAVISNIAAGNRSHENEKQMRSSFLVV